MEDSRESPKKLKITIPLLSIYPKEMKSATHRDIFIPICIMAIFIITTSVCSWINE
jgi:hypothetical protein